VTSIFANPVSIHAHYTKTMLLRKWQAVRMVKASRFLFKDLQECIEGPLLEGHLRKIALGSILLINDFRIRIEKNGIGVIQRPVESVLDVLLCFFLGFCTRRAKVDEGRQAHFDRNSRKVFIDNFVNRLNGIVRRARVENLDGIHKLCDAQKVSLQIRRFILYNHIQNAFRHLLTRVFNQVSWANTHSIP
jgi:hypothetical protein